MAVKINLEKKVKFWRFVHHDASSVNIDRMSGDYNQAVQKLIQPRVKVSNDDAIPEEQVSRDYESLYPENYTEVEVAKIRKRAEMIQTVQGMKNLAFDNNILFWFSNHGQQLSDRSLVLNGSRNDGHQLTTPAGANPRPDSPGKSKNLMNFTLQPMATNPTSTAVLVAWAKLDMNGVDSSDAVEAFINSCQQTPSMMSVVSPNKSRNSVNLDASDKVKNPRSANNFKTFESKGKYFLKIHSGHNPEDEIVEVLFFESREKLEEWRGWLAKVPVCFLDLKHRYEFIQHRGRDGPYRIVDLRSSEMQFELAGRILDCTSAQSIVSSLEEARQECYVLLDMQKYGIAPVFREIHLYGTQVWVITTPVTGVYLSDWFQDYLSKDSHEDTLASRVLQFILALMQSVKTLVDCGVSHNSISKDKILAEGCKCSECSTRLSSKNLLGMISDVNTPMSNLGFLSPEPFKKRSHIAPPQRSKISKPDCLFSTAISAAQGVSSVGIEPHHQVQFRITSFWTTKRFTFSDRLGSTHSRISQILDIPSKITMTESRRPAPESLDVYSLGLISYEILYGVDILKSQRLSQISVSQKNDYIEVLLNNPVKYIGHREPLYKVDSEVLLLLALMLHPDPANRPTIEECIEVMRTACFSEEQKALNKQKSPNLSSTDSKLMRKADGYFADPGPVQMQRFESWDGCSPMASNLFESPSSHAIIDHANSPLISLANWRAGKLKLSKHTVLSSKGSKLIQGQGSLIRSNSRSSVGVRSNESSSNQFSALDRKNSPPKPEFSRDRVCNPKIRPLLLDKREALRIKGTPKANQSPSLRYIKERVGFMGDIDPIPQGVTITKPKSNFAEYCKKFSLKKEKNFSFKKDQTDTSVSILCLDEVPNGDPSNLEDEEIETHIPALSVLVKKLLPKPQWKPTCRLLTHLQRGMNLESTINPSPRLSCARLRTTEDIVPFPED